MKSVNEMQNEGVVYIPVTYESIRNIANLQTVAISKDILKTLPEERITFIQLAQDNSMNLVNNNDDGYAQEQMSTGHIENTNFSYNIDLPANGTAKTQAAEFLCATCKQTFTKLALYRKHIDFHSNMKKYKCKHCFESYNVEDNFKLHMAMHTSGSPVCPLCNKKFQRFAGFKSHLLLHQVDETFTCKECLAEFEKETDYYKHIERHTAADDVKEEKLPYVCSYCNYIFDDLVKYKDHINHHIKMKKLVFNSKRTRKKTTDNKDKPHKCTTCGKSFRKTCLLERHIRIHSGERPYACAKCDKRFTQKGSLQIHSLKHTGHKPHKCTLCPASFFQKCNLRVHVEKAHTAPRDISKVYKCKQCTCVFRKIASLNAHITKVHTGLKQVPDEFREVAEQLKELQQMTGQMTVRRNDEGIVQTEAYVQLSETCVDGSVRNYVVKQRMMGTMKVYLCTYCSKEFKKPSDLIRHVRVHTREKPYVCRLCETAFSLKSVLQSHMNTHLGKIEYQCLVCLKLFSSTKRLTKHMKTHGNSKEAATMKYKCSSCDKLFTTLQSIKLHMELHKCQSSGSTDSVEKIPPSSIGMKQPILKTQVGLIELASPNLLAPYVQTDQSRPFKCHLCPGAFMKSDHLRHHMNSHNLQKTLKCDICEKSFLCASSLNSHKLNHGTRKHECGICFKKFTKESYLQTHQLQHINMGNYMCPYCKREFKNAQHCRKHIRTHKNDQLNLSGEDSLPISVVKSTDLPETDYGTNMFDIKGESILAHALELNREQISKESDELEKLNSTKSLNSEQSSVIINQEITEDVNKQMTYSITFPDETGLQNVEIASASAEGNQDYSTVFINCNDLQQIDAGIFDSGLTQAKMTATNPVLDEPQDVNLLFMDPLGQQVDFQETQNFESFNQVMLEDAVVSDEINLNGEGVNLEIQKSVASHDMAPENILPSIMDIHNPSGIKINLIESSEPEQNKVILKQVPKLILPVENADSGLKENVYITISVDGLKANSISYFSEMVDLNNAINETNATVEDLNLVTTSDVLVTEDAGGECITCAVCKLSCETLEDLASHQCIDVLNKNEEENIEPTSSEENQELVDMRESVSELEEKRQDTSDENQIELSTIKDVIQSDHEIKEAAGTESAKKKSSKICDFCQKEFKKLSDLQRHIRTHTGERPYKCEKCVKSFSLKSTLISHMRTHNPTDSKITCHICNYTYSCKASLKVHMMIHSGVKPYQCHLCPARFRTAAHRRIHVSKHEQLSKPKKKGTIKSDIKNVLTYTNSYFESMLSDDRGNSGEVQLTDSPNVDINAKVINSNSIDPSETLTIGDSSLQIDFLQQLQQLGQHLIFDMDEIQDKNINQSLIIENLTEQPGVNVEIPSAIPAVKEKKFGCDICGKMYSTKSILRKHQKNHKKFVCSKCRKQFDVEDELEKHMKIHMGYRPFSCLHCANSFSEEASLKTHMKRIHNLMS